MTQQVAQKSKRAIVAAVHLNSVRDLEFDASLAELRQLAKTLGFEVVGMFAQKRAGFDKTAYFGEGKREELRLLREQHSADAFSSTTRSRPRRRSTWRRRSAAR